MNKIEQLKAELDAKIKLVAEQAREKATIAKLTAQLGVLDSPVYQDALVSQSRQQAAIDRLSDLVSTAEAVVSAMPIIDPVKKQEKRWNGRPLYGHGIELNNLYQLLTGIMYSTRQHKAVMLEQTGLTEALVESTVNAFGQPSYFSIRNNKVIPAIPYDIEALQRLLPLVCATLDIEIPMSYITKQAFEERFNVAAERASSDQAQHELTQLTVGDTNFTMSE